MAEFYDEGRPKFDIGRLRHKVSLQARTDVKGPTGQNKAAWNTVGTYRALVENLTGRELVNAAQLKNTIKHKITMRNVGPITPANQLLFEATGRIFNVEFVYRVDERNAFYEIWCTEQISPP